MPSDFTLLLDAAAHKIRARIRTSRAIASLALAGAGIGIAALADGHGEPLSHGARWAALFAALGASALAGAVAFRAARARWSRLGIARALEARQAQDRELFVTALEAEAQSEAQSQAPAGTPSENKSSFTAEFRALLASQAALRLAASDLRPLVAKQRLVPPCAAVGVVFVALLSGAFVSTDFSTGLCRVCSPWSSRTYTTILEVEAPQDALPGETPRVMVKTGGRRASAVIVEVVPASGATQRLAAALDGDGRWSISFPVPDCDFQLRLHADDAPQVVRAVPLRFQAIRNAIYWPEAFARKDTAISGFQAAFPEKSAFVWRVRLATDCQKARVELRRKDKPEEVKTLPMTPETDGFLGASSLFLTEGLHEARIVSTTVNGTERPAPWEPLDCRKDKPPEVRLVTPKGPVCAVSPMDQLDCAIEARDDWGLRQVGLSLMVDDTTTDEGVVQEDGLRLSAAETLKFLVTRHPELRADQSIMLFAYAKDAAGQVTCSEPVAVDIAPIAGGGDEEKKKEEEKKKGPQKPQKKKKEKKDILGELIERQRRVVGRTIAAQDAAPALRDAVAKEQQEAIAVLEKALDPEARKEEEEPPPDPFDPAGVEDPNHPGVRYLRPGPK